MGKQEEYDKKVKEKEEQEEEQDRLEQENEDYDEMIKRLETAKTTVTAEKNTFERIKKNTNTALESELKWTGDNYNKYVTKGGYLSAENQNYYDNSLDFVLDEINLKITDIKKLRRGNETLLEKIANVITDLATEIENWWN